MTPGSIVLLHPDWLWLLVLLFAIALLWRFVFGADHSTDYSQTNISLLHPLVSLIPQTKPVNRQRLFHQFILWLVLGCLALALSQPVRLGKQLPEPPRQRDIVFIVDTSLSMILRDYVLNGQRIERISVLKNLLEQFVQRLQGERIAVVVFGDTAHTLVPLTRDQNLLTSMIKRISAGMVKRQNAMGDAIAMAVHAASQDKTRNRILVLFTDAGDDTGSVTPLAGAQLAAEAGLPLYTVAIGAATIQAEEQQRYSGLLYQTVDKDLLKSISNTTGAISYQAGDSTTLKRAIADITRYKTQAGAVRVKYSHQALYLWPLLLGLCLFTVQQFMRLLKRGRL